MGSFPAIFQIQRVEIVPQLAIAYDLYNNSLITDSDPDNNAKAELRTIEYARQSLNIIVALSLRTLGNIANFFV